MSLLEQYEQQYAALIAEITAHIGRLQQNTTAERNELCTKIDASLSEAQELLEQMGLEVRELNPLQRSNFNNKIQVAQAELKRLQGEYKQTKDRLRSQANSFTTLDLAGSGDYYEDVAISNDQRQRLLENSERIERTGNRLNEGYRVAIETEALGAQVLNDLHHQRETLQGARARLRETNADLGRASRTLNSMMLRALREKVVLYGVGICFVVAVGVSLYLTFAPSSTAATS
ncbi:PREDICTED: vesicle transport through interaction with t-SNAREs homolog 1A isoform X1 [Drosophila arizonae]|uniref:Vesicle transport through interaction with t-SNAREs homolog 1A isoform X1 n=1 Tax=Drosophila arizonae TaxID=7263 RepID=A0ABM1PAK6_DROAR|nr:PREDICTED: vesicle transport through interaction with t-SNAREs homolog 1A isoform X1 [Drosophila arizonae]